MVPECVANNFEAAIQIMANNKITIHFADAMFSACDSDIVFEDVSVFLKHNNIASAAIVQAEIQKLLDQQLAGFRRESGADDMPNLKGAWIDSDKHRLTPTTIAFGFSLNYGGGYCGVDADFDCVFAAENGEIKVEKFNYSSAYTDG